MTNFRKLQYRLIEQNISIAPLITFRILFGVIMFISIVRFAANGWIREFYIDPTYHFTYYGFDWVQPIGGNGMYLVFILLAISSLCIALGFRYRIATVSFFLLFTYVELLDKTFYLNHYYFISIVSLILIFLPANRRLSLDVHLNPKLAVSAVPAWCINVLKLQLGLVYFFAGIAKINSDWLLKALPLKIWLPARSHWPIVGTLFNKTWVAYAFSWGGMLYDVMIPFLMVWNRTRKLAYLAVVFFHIMTWLLFPIGMFPFIMIGLTLIFFPATLHEKILHYLKNLLAISESKSDVDYELPRFAKKGTTIILALFLVLQITLPFRYLLYPGSLFWTEQGYRFSWRVMLTEKVGMCDFVIKDQQKTVAVDNSKYLTLLQEHMMATQPDMILQFAHFLKKQSEKDGMADPEIYVDCVVSLQGQRSKPFIDPEVNLALQERGFRHKNWIIPFEKE